jgi:hypothetical protein
MVHEVLGHGAACRLTGVRRLGLSTIGLQTETSSRLVASAGAIANVIAGVLSLAVARRRRFDVSGYFLWLFGFVNLMNGTGYLMASALTGSGDWAVVVAGREPALVWRLSMGLIGVITFAASILWARDVMRRWVVAGEVAAEDVPRLTVTPYLAGGLLFTLASVFNPVGPGMILTSGIAASFGLTFGLLFVARASFPAPAAASAPQALPMNTAWVVLGFAVAIVFVAVLGPGVRF